MFEAKLTLTGIFSNWSDLVPRLTRQVREKYLKNRQSSVVKLYIVKKKCACTSSSISHSDLLHHSSILDIPRVIIHIYVMHKSLLLSSSSSSSDILLSTAKLESHSASISLIQKSFYSRGVTPSPQRSSTRIRPKKICQLDRKCGWSFHFKRQPEERCLCIVKEGARL